MAKGSVAHGKDAHLYVGRADVSGDTTAVAWAMNTAVAEAMGLADSWEEFVAGLQGSKIGVEGLLNDDASLGAWGLHGNNIGSQLYMGFYPLGNTVGYPGLEAYPHMVSQTPLANLTSAVLHSWEWQAEQEVDHMYLLEDATKTATYSGTAVVGVCGGVSHESDDNVDAGVDLTSAGEEKKLGMQFQVDHGGTVSRIRLWLKKTGTPAGNLTAAIWSDSSSLPDAAITNGTSSNVAADSLATSYGWIDFTFSTDPVIEGGTVYHIVLASSGYTYADGVTEVIWGVDQSSPRTTNYFSHRNSSWSNYGTNSTAAYQVHYAGEKLIGILRVEAVSGTSPTLDVKVQDAPDNSTWADVITFAQKAAVGVERVEQANEPTDEDIRIDVTIGGTTPSFTFMVGAGERDISN